MARILVSAGLLVTVLLLGCGPAPAPTATALPTATADPLDGLVPVGGIAPGDCFETAEDYPDDLVRPADCALGPYATVEDEAEGLVSRFEMLASTTLNDGDYLGVAELRQVADAACAPYDRDHDDRLRYVPSRSSWNRGDRNLLCLAPAGSQ